MREPLCKTVKRMLKRPGQTDEGLTDTYLKALEERYLGRKRAFGRECYYRRKVREYLAT